MKRHMKLEGEGITLYESTFDPKTGAIVRATEERPDDNDGDLWQERIAWDEACETATKAFKDRFSTRDERVPSPSPELMDISITNKCGFGCSYCYQDSTAKDPHGSKHLVPDIIEGMDNAPYQVAIGGGEPTLHPDFAWILLQTKQLGVVPNYTTNGANLDDTIVAVTNEVCGGVAMTYHGFKGYPWFYEHYLRLSRALTCQVNIHLIADAECASRLMDLIDLQKKTGPLNVVLLAYYPDVGRASMANLLTKASYQRALPEVIKQALAAGMNIAFSEGMLPYFLSRPEIGIDTQFAIGSEGWYSCYFDHTGRMSASSFDKPREDSATVYDASPQDMWHELPRWNLSRNNTGACRDCPDRKRCAVPHKFHALTCARQPHNEAV